jgi:outer membrane protein assembly factor BamA
LSLINSRTFLKRKETGKKLSSYKKYTGRSNTLLIAIILCSLFSCNVLKNVPADDKLYTGSSVDAPKKDLNKEVKEFMEQSGRPKPNTSFLGIKYRLMLFNLIKEPKKQKGFFYKVKHKWGEAPVLLSQVSPRASINRYNNILFANGYLRPETTLRINSKGRKASIQYLVDPGTRYVIDSVAFPTDSSALSRLFTECSPNTLLKKGDYVDLGIMEAERQRIDLFLRGKGYYYFVPDNIIVRVDSLHKGKAHLYLALKLGLPQASTEPWRIGDITIYGNYTLEKDSAIAKQKGIQEKNYTIVDRRNTYKTHVYDKTIALTKDELYNRKKHSLTIERLMNLGTFKFVRMGFFSKKDSLSTDTADNVIDTKIYLSPAKKQTLRIELSGNSKSNNFIGSEVSLNYRNINLFRGAEILDVKIAGGFDWQVGGANQLSPNAQTLDAEVNLTVPGVLSFFKGSKKNIRIYDDPFIPRTVYSGALEYLRRPNLYLLRSFKFSLGFISKKGKAIEHNIKLLNINSINTSNITPEFEEILKNDVTLRASFENQLIFGSRYMFTYNNTYKTDKRFTVSLYGGINFSGWPNFFIKTNVDTPNAKKLFGIPVSNFIKWEIGGTAYFNVSKKITWVNRLITGAAIAYGNRAFRIRTLGPGSYHTAEKEFLANESGEIKVEINSEMRLNVSRYIKMAAFIDAGNIWLRKDATDKPGSGFNGAKDMLKEMAVGTGIGLRFDASVLVIRFDVAFPIRKPWYPDGKRWVFNEIDLGNSSWRKENLILNIGIGYPF